MNKRAAAAMHETRCQQEILATAAAEEAELSAGLDLVLGENEDAAEDLPSQIRSLEKRRKEGLDRLASISEILLRGTHILSSLQQTQLELLERERALLRQQQP